MSKATTIDNRSTADLNSLTIKPERATPFKIVAESKKAVYNLVFGHDTCDVYTTSDDSSRRYELVCKIQAK
jgi:hypothetical protein